MTPTRRTCGSIHPRPPGHGTCRPSAAWMRRWPRRRTSSTQGDLRFAAELASHAVFAEPDHDAARELLAAVLERLGYGAENATWRNSYLTGAKELRTGTIEHTEVSSAGLAPALTITQLFDSIAIRINGPKAWDEKLSIGWHFTDDRRNYDGTQQRRPHPLPHQSTNQSRRQRQCHPASNTRTGDGRSL